MQADDIPVGDNTFVSYAQNFEDVLLWRALRHISNGIYVDVGACDPVEYSVTKAFYDRGWSGINVEPVDGYAKRLAEFRPRDLNVQVAASDFDGTSSLYMARGTGLSTLVESRVSDLNDRGFDVEVVDVEVHRLDYLIDNSPYSGCEIHFLKIDAEGAEGQVIEGLNLARIRPWVVMVESTALLSPQRTDDVWNSSLLANDYVFAFFDGLNSIYVALEHPELIPLLSYPVGVHDQPFLPSQSPALRQFMRQHREAARLKAASQLGRASAEIDRLMRHIDSENRDRSRLEAEIAALAEQLRATDESLHAVDAEMHRRRRQLLESETELAALTHAHAELTRSYREIEQQCELLNRAIDATHNTLSWKITKPLRAVKGALQFKSVPAGSNPAVAPRLKSEVDEPTPASRVGGALHTAMLHRLGQVKYLISGDETGKSSGDPWLQLSKCLAQSDVEQRVSAWLVLVAAGNAYPNELELNQATRLLRQDGPNALLQCARRFFVDCVRLGRATDLPLEILTDSVLVDVSHTAAHSLHTGIQRVVRETVTRWVESYPTVALFYWDFRSNSPKLLSDAEVNRFRDWRTHVALSVDDHPRKIEPATGRVVVPWNCSVIIPELAAEPERCNAYRAMKSTGTCTLSLIVYDLIPFTASETVADGMTGMFANAISVAKAADRVSAISKATAAEYRNFVAMLAQQGLAGPQVMAHPLPAARLEVSEQDMVRNRERYLGSSPMVLVLGSHEPRKNHVTVLESAESLWRSGLRFQLVFVGGSGWKMHEFEQFVGRLQQLGRDIQVIKRASEIDVWSLYRLARFTVFPSLVEGYGLPISESLVCGTPVITSNHGSMREVGEGGGAILVDPRSPEELAHAMRKLLTDDSLLEELRRQAAARSWPTWDTYAKEVWSDLVGGRKRESSHSSLATD